MKLVGVNIFASYSADYISLLVLLKSLNILLWPRGPQKRFLCSTHMSVKVILLINIEMPTIKEFRYLLAG